MRGAARFPTYVGRILIVVGFLMIVIAWNEAAELDFIQGQFPYLLSGAMPGLALIIVGAGLEYVQTMRELTAQRAKQMAEINLAVVKLIGYVKETGGLIQGPDSEALDAAARGHAHSAAPGTGQAPGASRGGTVSATAPTATAVAQRSAHDEAQPAEERVVAGRSSFHDPACHLVSGRDDMASITRLEAEGQGLSACKVCKP